MKRKQRYGFKVNSPSPVEEDLQPQIILASPEMMGGDGPENNRVEVVNNKIYFYSEVERNSILALNKCLVELDEQIQSQNLEWKCPEDSVKIYLHINSFGGHLFDAFSTIDYIRNLKTEVVSVIDGCAASAATLISTACHKRVINKHAFMLIHQLSSGMFGSYSHMKDEIENCDMLMKILKKVYKEYTKIPSKKLNEILDHDIWFSAETCLQYSLVDEII